MRSWFYFVCFALQFLAILARETTAAGDMGPARLPFRMQLVESSEGPHKTSTTRMAKVGPELAATKLMGFVRWKYNLYPGFNIVSIPFRSLSTDKGERVETEGDLLSVTGATFLARATRASGQTRFEVALPGFLDGAPLVLGRGYILGMKHSSQVVITGVPHLGEVRAKGPMVGYPGAIKASETLSDLAALGNASASLCTEDGKLRVYMPGFMPSAPKAIPGVGYLLLGRNVEDEVVFQHNAGAESFLYTSFADTGEALQEFNTRYRIVDGEDREVAPPFSGYSDWFPDGESFVHVIDGLERREPVDGTGMERRYLDGTTEDLLLPQTDASISKMAVSLDGRKIVYEIGFSGLEVSNNRLFVLDLESGASTRLTTFNVWERSPSFGPDGMLYFTMGSRSEDGVIVRMRLDGGTVETIVAQAGFANFPKVSPDNRYLYWYLGEYGSPKVQDIWRRRLDILGARPERLFETPNQREFAPGLSRDGTLLYHSVADDVNFFTPHERGIETGATRSLGAEPPAISIDVRPFRFHSP